MASPGGIKSAAESYRGSFSESSTAAAPYSDTYSFDDDDDFLDYSAENLRPTLFGRLLQVVAMPTRRRRRSPDFLSSPQEELLPDGLLKKRHSPRELRRCRRSYLAGCLKRASFILPVVALMALGVLHLLKAFVGRAGVFWDPYPVDDFLPNWGQSGQPGEGLVEYPTDATRDVIPIPCHSHNDYWRRVPLYDAIHWGCTGVEADVWLFDEELYVGHNTAALTKNRTFRNLYVNPIVEMLDKMNNDTEFAKTSGHGVFDVDPNQSLTLLVDFKTAGRDTFPFVHEQLSALREKDYLTYFDGEKVHSRAVTVVGTGNTPFDMVVSNSTHRDIFFDAPLDKMWDPLHKVQTSKKRADANDRQPSSQGTIGTEMIASADDFNATTSYYASVSFTHTVGFIWNGELSTRQMETIRGQIRGAHRRGLKVRYWNTPTWPVDLRNHVWHVLMKEGADMLNVDDLKGAAIESWKARVRGFW